MKCNVKMSSQGDDSSGSNHSDDNYNNQEDYKLEIEHEENEETDSEPIDNWPPDPLATDCPSTILAKWARGSYDPKSPLRQFATRITTQTASGGGTRKWKRNICGTKWFGSITRVNVHFLFWTGKGVGACKFLMESKTLHYRIEFTTLWGDPNDLGVQVPTTLTGRQHIQSLQQTCQYGQTRISTPRL